jgi:hypothetical protein
MFHDVGALALTLLNVDGGAEEGAEGDAATADADHACRLAQRPVELTTHDLNLFHKTLERMSRGQGETRWCLLAAIGDWAGRTHARPPWPGSETAGLTARMALWRAGVVRLGGA